MDTTLATICPACKHPEMDSHGGSFGGRIMSWQKKCPKCDCTILFVPMRSEYRYSISALSETEETERAEKQSELNKLKEQVTKLERELR